MQNISESALFSQFVHINKEFDIHFALKKGILNIKYVESSDGVCN